MAAKQYVLAIDQGTTSTRAILFDGGGRPRATASEDLEQIYPRPGWVEHDAEAIWQAVLSVGREVLGQVGAGEVAAVGITNQRETTVVWERQTGRPVGNAIVWQDRRTAEICDQLRADGLEAHITEVTGLLPDPYFSATKLAWMLSERPELRDRAAAGELCFGTIDAWLIFKLTGGAVHATDATNASRTMLYDIGEGAWDQRLLERLDIPAAMLPEV
ncbi:MAG: FGGY family carbohydrate kinase, partial [Methyloligellaceae bacterium]